jgi:hypothetical protein
MVRITPFALILLVPMFLAACGGGGSGNSMQSTLPVTSGTAPTAPNSSGSASMMSSGSASTVNTIQSAAVAPLSMVDTDTVDDVGPDNSNSILATLNTITTIGSTIVNGQQNPYGLDVAKSAAGNITAGDLVVCNFNNKNNVQGTGNTLLALHPQPGSAPTLIAQDRTLQGCDAIALAPTDNIWAAAFSANDNPIFSPAGSLVALPSGPWHHPFGQTFAPHGAPGGNAAFFESNAQDGSIVRININPGPTFSFDVIARGFPVNGGQPGSILGPSGLQYDDKHDRLYIVDGTNNALYAVRHVSTIPAGGIVVHSMTFSGPFAKRARVVLSGSPLNGPISSLLLFNGNLILGNTLDPTGQNLMVELTPRGKVLNVRNVDTGAAGALFGMVATGTTSDDTMVYFNDDNDNTVKSLTH